MAEIYSTINAVNTIKQTVNIININHYLLQFNLKQIFVVLYVV